MNWLFEQTQLVHDFIQSGGYVLWIIAGVLLMLWLLVLERVFYLALTFPTQSTSMIEAWSARLDKSSWYAQQIRHAWLAQAELKLKRNMAFLNAVIKICPLLGLLGTVSGMIQVFDVVAVHGTGNPRLLASGISMATVPTMAGLVCALSGLFIYSRLESYRQSLMTRLAKSLEQA